MLSWIKARPSAEVALVDAITTSSPFHLGLKRRYKFYLMTELSIVSPPISPASTSWLRYTHLLGRALSLRVPLAHIHSTTYAFYPDETPTTIRRVFTPDHSPHTKRHFCGICGTQLSHWSEESPDEAELIYVNLKTLRSESFDRLEDAGFLSGVSSEDEKEGTRESSKEPKHVTAIGQGREVQGSPWFEEMIEGSQLGRLRRRRGGQSSSDGSTRVEWEVTEFDSGEADEGSVNNNKRKLGSLGETEDIEMRSG